MSTSKVQPANFIEPIHIVSNATVPQPRKPFEPVEIISTTIVTPANSSKDQPHRIELSPLDLPFLLVDYINRGILFLKPTQTQEKELGNNLITHLKASLSRALDIFPPFAGRLAAVDENDIEDKTTSFFLDCNGAGAQFVHAVSPGLTVADVLEPLYVPSNIINFFFSMNGVYNCEGVTARVKFGFLPGLLKSLYSDLPNELILGN
ncbi:hypothetical protein Tsubulata_025599 [Turnera subulata]|uniref:Uncharacterized protein n=1 Tax=Turnera subulata TaxID=218843 RepID=A0A9Q0FR43_9ROSI|nr:hypothetical protein Tsubulata_025599 [Turnera subulata]